MTFDDGFTTINSSFLLMNKNCYNFSNCTNLRFYEEINVRPKQFASLTDPGVSSIISPKEELTIDLGHCKYLLRRVK